HDDAFHNPYPTQESCSALMRAYADCGLRATVAINHQNLTEYVKYPFLEEILPAEIRAKMDRAPRATAQGMAALYRWYLATWHHAVPQAARCRHPDCARQRRARGRRHHRHVGGRQNGEPDPSRHRSGILALAGATRNP